MVICSCDVSKINKMYEKNSRIFNVNNMNEQKYINMKIIPNMTESIQDVTITMYFGAFQLIFQHENTLSCHANENNYNNIISIIIQYREMECNYIKYLCCTDAFAF